jgi:ectoine hydroxylase-related dioxygenase (phytanoyl-CoA dioxygenase family)
MTNAAYRHPEADPGLCTPYNVTEADIEGFKTNGHVLLRGVCSSDEIATYRPIINAGTERYKTETRPMEERDTYGKAFLQIMNLWHRDQAVRRYTLASRFAGIAAKLLGVPSVRLYHDQALYKEPHGGHTPWHQDQYYWPLDTVGTQTVTMWMPLVDVSLDMGALTFASGTHEDGFMGHIKISDESEQLFENYVKEKGVPIVQQAMTAGDATFHSGWCLHCAPGNASSTMREVMTVIYFADGIKVLEPDNSNREDDLKTWLPGLKPGDLAASPINPVVYNEQP